MITINIQKKEMYLLSAIIVFLVGVGIIIAYNSGADPSIMGHDPSEIGPGTFNTEGDVDPSWSFPGNVNVTKNLKANEIKSAAVLIGLPETTTPLAKLHVGGFNEGSCVPKGSGPTLCEDRSISNCNEGCEVENSCSGGSKKSVFEDSTACSTCGAPGYDSCPDNCGVNRYADPTGCHWVGSGCHTPCLGNPPCSLSDACTTNTYPQSGCCYLNAQKTGCILYSNCCQGSCTFNQECAGSPDSCSSYNTQNSCDAITGCEWANIVAQFDGDINVEGINLGLEDYYTDYGECSSYPAPVPACLEGEFKLGEDQFDDCGGPNQYQIRTKCLRLITL